MQKHFSSYLLYFIIKLCPKDRKASKDHKSFNVDKISINQRIKRSLGKIENACNANVHTKITLLGLNYLLLKRSLPQSIISLMKFRLS